MRQLAWLNAVPEGSKKSRLKFYKEQDEESNFLKLPPIEGAEYLVGLLNEAGLLTSNGMGASPLTWAEIESWLRCTQLELTTWEILLVKQMSEVYVGEYSQASEKARPAPFVYADALAVDRQAVASKLKSAFAAFKRKSS